MVEVDGQNSLESGTGESVVMGIVEPEMTWRVPVLVVDLSGYQS